MNIREQCSRLAQSLCRRGSIVAPPTLSPRGNGGHCRHRKRSFSRLAARVLVGVSQFLVSRRMKTRGSEKEHSRMKEKMAEPRNRSCPTTALLQRE